MVTLIYNCIEKLQSVLFSPTCILCGQLTHTTASLCPECTTELPYNKQCCSCCSIPLDQKTQKKLLCGACQKQPLSYQYSQIPLIYKKPINRFIQNFKFNNDFVTGKILCDIFESRLPNVSKIKPQALVPVPLHPSRIRLRGYNQALWLANRLSKFTGIKVDNNLIKRIKKTSPQQELKSKQRRTNLKDAFQLNKTIHYKSIAIIDDVVTTGTTVSEIAKLFKKEGVAQIEVWALARTVQSFKK